MNTSKLIDLSSKKSELLSVVDNLDLPTTMILQGVLLEHAMKLTGMQKKAESIIKVKP